MALKTSLVAVCNLEKEFDAETRNFNNISTKIKDVNKKFEKHSEKQAEIVTQAFQNADVVPPVNFHSKKKNL